MEKISASERKKLKADAHHLKPVIMIGQKGLTAELIKATDKALSDHELIKIKFIDFKDEKKEIAEEIASKTNSQIVGIIGNVLTLFRENQDKE